jgi:hypothetical protein
VSRDITVRPQQDSNLRTRLGDHAPMRAKSSVDLRKRWLKWDWGAISIVILSCPAVIIGTPSGGFGRVH